MPAKRTARPVRRRVYLTTDDLLVRLIDLPEREQEEVLAALANAIDKAERAVIARQSILYDARQASRPAIANAGAAGA